MSHDEPGNDSPNLSEKITEVVLYLQQDDEEQLGFWANWKPVYLMILIYGMLQIVVLYFFTRIFNHS